jgi:TonB family protein
MLSYFLYVNLYAALFFGLYVLFLKNRGTYQWSRFYLLISSLLSVILPLVKSTFFQPMRLPPEYTFSSRIPEMALPPGTGTMIAQGIDLSGAYLVICLFLFLRLLIPFVRLSLLVKRLRRQQGGARILTHTRIGPGSFGKTILFPSGVIEVSILGHEQQHIREKHYLDKIYFHLLLCFFFPVVAFYFIKKEAGIVGEFQADAAAAIDKEDYFRLLLQQHFSSAPLFLQSFYHHPLKRRIMMLTQTPRPARRKILSLTAIAMTTVLLLFQNAAPIRAQEKTPSEKTYNVVEQMPEFPGGSQALNEYLIHHLNYPESAIKDTLEGKVFIQFVVLPTGKIGTVKILKGLSADSDEEVIRVIKNMPDWKPGEQGGKRVAVYYTLPVTFSLKSRR